MREKDEMDKCKEVDRKNERGRLYVSLFFKLNIGGILRLGFVIVRPTLGVW